MSHLVPSPSSFQSTEQINQGIVTPLSGESQRQRYAPFSYLLLISFMNNHGPRSTGDSPSSEDQCVDLRFEGGVEWVGKRWCLRLAHACRRWRDLILGLASQLDCLICTCGTPVADMPVLAHSATLPLLVDYQDTDITAEDEEARILAIEQRNRVRHGASGLIYLF